MMRSVVVVGNPPPVCELNSQRENASGSTAVPPEGAPHATVAWACGAPDLTPRTGAKRYCRVLSVRTVTRPEVWVSEGVSTVALTPAERSLAVAIACAVWDGLAQGTGALTQSWAMARARAWGAVCSCCLPQYSPAASMLRAEKAIRGTMTRATTTATAPRSSFPRRIA